METSNTTVSSTPVVSPTATTPTPAVSPVTPATPVEVKKDNKNKMIVALSLLVLILAIALGAFFILSKPKQTDNVTPSPTPIVSGAVTNPTPTPTPNPVPTQTPTPTPSPDFYTATYTNKLIGYEMTFTTDIWKSRCGYGDCGETPAKDDDISAVFASNLPIGQGSFASIEMDGRRYLGTKTWAQVKQEIINEAQNDGSTVTELKINGTDVLKVVRSANSQASLEGRLRVDYFVDDSRPESFLDMITYDDVAGTNQAAIFKLISSFKLK